jgi:hypothetical protein
VRPLLDARIGGGETEVRADPQGLSGRLRPFVEMITLPAEQGASELGVGRTDGAALRRVWDARSLVFRASRARGMVARAATCLPGARLPRLPLTGTRSA